MHCHHFKLSERMDSFGGFPRMDWRNFLFALLLYMCISRFHLLLVDLPRSFPRILSAFEFPGIC
jgi:hypothetical protein